MSLDILKLNKQLVTAMELKGFEEPLEIQAKILSRIQGGGDIVAIAPEGSGKSTALVLGVLARLKYDFEVAPRALVLAPDKESVLILTELFEELGLRTGIRVLPMYAGVAIEVQRDDLAAGCDVVIATPDRALTLYQKSALNINKLMMFVLDDAEIIVKNGFHTSVSLLTESLLKCQHLVFTEVVHSKIDRLIDPFMHYPSYIEVSLPDEAELTVIDQVLYKVPNYKTKLNLLNFMMSNDAYFTKVVVFMNSRITAENIYTSLDKRFVGSIGMFNPSDLEQKGFHAIEDFKADEETRILCVVNDSKFEFDLHDIPCIIHFDIPLSMELVLDRVAVNENDIDDRININFATDMELSLVVKLEHAIGEKFPVEDIPEGVVIEGDAKFKTAAEEAESDPNKKSSDPNVGAFHEKKEHNAKNYNYGFKEKLKLFGRNRKNRKN